VVKYLRAAPVGVHVWASRASLLPRRWATTCRRLSLHPCTAPLSCSLQPLVKLLLLSLRPSLLQFVLIVSLLLNHTCAIPSVCNAVGLLILLKLCPVFTFLQQLMTKRLWVIYTYACSPMFSINVVTSAPDDPSFFYVFADSRIALLCHALRICVAHAPLESCTFSFLVHWAFHACYRNHLPLLHHASLPQNWSVQTSIPGQPLWAPRWCFCVAR